MKISIRLPTGAFRPVDRLESIGVVPSVISTTFTPYRRKSKGFRRHVRRIKSERQ